MADLGEALRVAGAIALVACDAAIDIAARRERLAIEAVELHAEQRLEPRDELCVDAERVEPPDRDLLVERFLGAALRRRLRARDERRDERTGNRESPRHDVQILHRPPGGVLA